MARLTLWRDSIGPTLALAVAETPYRVTEQMEADADTVLDYAQENAPWSDITGAARSELYCEVFEDGGEIVLELGHGVDYGVWLETIQAGAYAIIMPTLEALGPEVINNAGGEVVNIHPGEFE